MYSVVVAVEAAVLMMTFAVTTVAAVMVPGGCHINPRNQRHKRECCICAATAVCLS